VASLELDSTAGFDPMPQKRKMGVPELVAVPPIRKVREWMGHGELGWEQKTKPRLRVDAGRGVAEVVAG
jgi:hypothetical protein